MDAAAPLGSILRTRLITIVCVWARVGARRAAGSARLSISIFDEIPGRHEDASTTAMPTESGPAFKDPITPLLMSGEFFYFAYGASEIRRFVELGNYGG